MKTHGTPHDPACGHGSSAPAGPAGGEGSTRRAVARLLMEQGPIAAASVAAELELSAPAVRRHLDALIADGEAEARSQPSSRPRGRGRPAREYVLTDAGRVRFGHGYDDLATSALRFLAEQAGTDAVDAFARLRVRELVAGAREEITAPDGPDGRAEALARVLSARGYAAQARKAGRGVQLCQHHCPVAQVAAEFPELCEAETRAFSELLGTHVQRLATIARGDAACTTHVPLEDPELLARAKQHQRDGAPSRTGKGKQEWAGQRADNPTPRPGDGGTPTTGERHRTTREAGNR